MIAKENLEKELKAELPTILENLKSQDDQRIKMKTMTNFNQRKLSVEPKVLNPKVHNLV
jgi:hypothetical protein